MTLELLAPSPTPIEPSPNSLPDPPYPLGSTYPRIWTPPLRPLTPETSYGFAVIYFAAVVLGEPLDPWEQWAVIHAGERLPDGRPRFRHVLILVARQNGKTHLVRVLTLFWLFIERHKLTLGLSTDRTYAKRQLQLVAEIARNNPTLAKLLPPSRGRGMAPGLSNETGFERLVTAAGCEYVIAATNRRAGRSLSIDRLIIDEIREHRNWDAWNACTKAMNARPFAQAFCITNQGDDTGVVLDKIREDALHAVTTGNTKHRTGLFDWSAPDGADLLDLEALAMANPNLGRRVFVEDLWDELVRAKRQGGVEEAGVRTEILCQRVKMMDGAVNPARWDAGHVPGDLANTAKSRIAFCVDLSVNRQHATLVAAAVMEDGRVRVETVNSWKGENAAAKLRAELPRWITARRPQTVGYIPNGPAAVLVADLKVRKGRAGWPPPGVNIVEITDEVAAVCMGLAEQVDAAQVVHGNDPLLNDHVKGAAKLWSGDRWRFSRQGDGECDAAYAAAGAVHLARTLPTPVGKPRLVMAKTS